MKNILQRFPENIRSIILTCIFSIAAGLSVVSFTLLINFLFTNTYNYFATKSLSFFIVASFLVITFSSLIVGYLVNVLSKEAAGSGVPQVKAAYWKELGFIKLKPVIVKFIAGILSVGGGNSLGREGPSIYLGSGIGSNLDGLFGASPRQRRNGTLIGASAGLAAAFNTPLAAITFFIEELVGDLNSRYLGRVVLSSVIGAFVVYVILGSQPAYTMSPVMNVSWYHYLVVPIAAVFASLAGVIFHQSTILFRGKFKKQKKIPLWLLPVFGGLITWFIGCSIYMATGKIGIFGLGYQDISAALNNNFEWKIAGIMVLGKLIATISGYSFGGCGGIFAPSLFIGGMSGYFIGGIAGIWIPLTPSDHIVLTIVGMSSCLGTIVHAPLTSILIVFEMTHQFSILPGLMLGTIISQAIAHRSAGKINFYDAILIQDGHELHKIKPPVDLQSWQNLPISAIANPNPIYLSELNEEKMKYLLEQYPFKAFPVIIKNQIQGIVTREQIEDAVTNHNLPIVHEIGICYSDQTVNDVGNKFIEKTVHVLLVVDRNTTAIKGIITLHDLIRAQAATQS